jgi:hypothetical protein
MVNCNKIFVKLASQLCNISPTKNWQKRTKLSNVCQLKDQNWMNVQLPHGDEPKDIYQSEKPKIAT